MVRAGVLAAEGRLGNLAVFSGEGPSNAWRTRL